MDYAAGSQESFSFNADNPGKYETSSVLGVMQRATAQYSQVRKQHWSAADNDSLGTLSDAGAFALWDSIAEKILLHSHPGDGRRRCQFAGPCESAAMACIQHRNRHVSSR